MSDAINSLGPFPIFQFFGGLLVLAGAAYALLRGERKKRYAETAEIAETRLAFDGPLVAALRLLEKSVDLQQKTTGLLTRIEEESRPKGEEQRKQTRLIEEINNKLDRLASGRRRRWNG